MSKLKKEVGVLHPEQKELISLFEQAAYRHSYWDTFNTLLDYGISQYIFTGFTKSDDFQFDSNWNDKEKAIFPKMLDEVIRLNRERCRLWTGQSGWYDAFGCLFESLIGNFGKSAMGQFFTPEVMCDLMAQIVIGSSDGENSIGELGDILIAVDGNIGRQKTQYKPETIAEPACGSGRLILAANNINPALYIVANDLDKVCAKMCALNMCLNGAIGEVSCNDGLFATENNFRFAYRVVPLTSIITDSFSSLHFLKMVMPSAVKQYCLIPMQFKDCRYNDEKVYAEQNEKHKRQQQESLAAMREQHDAHRKAIHPDTFQGVLFEAEKVTKTAKPKGANKQAQKISFEPLPTLF